MQLRQRCESAFCSALPPTVTVYRSHEWIEAMSIGSTPRREAAARLSKTIAILQLAARQPRCERHPAFTLAVVRNTLGQLRDTSIKTWLDWVPDGQLGTYAKSDLASD